MNDNIGHWHVTGEMWQAYSDGRLGADAEAAIETHVVGCSTCHASARPLVDTDALWEGVHALIDHPRPRVSRLLGRLGMPQDDFVVVAATDNLRLPWAIAVGAAITAAIGAAYAGSHELLLFVLLAPLVPVLAVAAAFDATDDLRELTNATPYARLRLTLLRTLATLIVAIPSMLALGLAIPVLHGFAWLWLLPALALTGTTVVLLTWWSARSAAVVTGFGWIAAVLLTESAGNLGLVGGPAGQAFFAVLALALAIAVVAGARQPQRIGAAS